MRAARERHGATLVLVIVLMVVIMAFAAFAVDLSQLYAYQSELQRSADAAAHAAGVELTKYDYANAGAAATAYVQANLVEGSSLTPGAVVLGEWDQGARAFIPAPTPDTNAIQVNLSGGPATPIFGGFLGVNGPLTVNVSAVAWAAPTIPSHDCMKPLAVRYSYAARNYMLANSDLRFNNGSPDPNSSTWTYETVTVAPGIANIDAQIDEPCAVNVDTLSPGDLLDTLSSTLDNNANEHAATWCTDVYGGGTEPCLMKLAVWDTTAVITTGTATDNVDCGGGACVRILEIVPFIINPGSIDPGAPQPPFTPPVSGGTFAGYPTTGIDEDNVIAAAGNPSNPWIYRVVLVQ